CSLCTSRDRCRNRFGRNWWHPRSARAEVVCITRFSTSSFKPSFLEPLFPYVGCYSDTHEEVDRSFAEQPSIVGTSFTRFHTEIDAATGRALHQRQRHAKTHADLLQLRTCNDPVVLGVAHTRAVGGAFEERSAAVPCRSEAGAKGIRRMGRELRSYFLIVHAHQVLRPIAPAVIGSQRPAAVVYAEACTDHQRQFSGALCAILEAHGIVREFHAEGTY